ncbi:MAG: N-acetylmuramoyl-L-alanine amidase [Rhodobacteraceae bacterium]|nr:N-acetylmuramoyl-L-alanine amidase [Paracoccaceae bacterium]
MLHYTAIGDAGEALDRLCSPEFEVSSHYLIAADGTLFQLVAEDKRAWHAGQGEWHGRGDVNSRSVGIELDNAGDAPFAEPQMKALETLLPELMQRWNIPPQNVIAHSDFAIGRKTDPGQKFDWHRLARSGLSIWPQQGEGVQPDRARFAAAAGRIGYPTAAGDGEFQLLLDAFRLRFSPWRKGKLTAADMHAVMDLANRFGADNLDRSEE